MKMNILKKTKKPAGNLYFKTVIFVMFFTVVLSALYMIYVMLFDVFCQFLNVVF